MGCEWLYLGKYLTLLCAFASCVCVFNLVVCVFLQVVGLYRLCGSASVKKELREAFERDSLGVELCENTYPDINVITGNITLPTASEPLSPNIY